MNKDELDLMIRNEEYKLMKQLYNAQQKQKKDQSLNKLIEDMTRRGAEERDDQIKKLMNKEEKTLLERAYDISNENSKVKKEIKIKPAKEIEIIESNYIIPYDDKYDKILYYIHKYRIPYLESGRKKSYKELAHAIHKYELANKKKIINSGLDKKYKEYGLYVKAI
jgi:hypothetical protein